MKKKNVVLSTSTFLPGNFSVQYEVARAGYIPSERDIALGKVALHCEGAKEIKHLIYWSKDGVRQDSAEFHDDPYQSSVTSVYRVSACFYWAIVSQLCHYLT